jgi:hypothetical protein
VKKLKLLPALFFVFLCSSAFTLICDDTPELNREVVQFAKSNIGKKIGRGECWDLAAEALNKAGATWDGQFGFGKKIDPLKDCVYPGDVIQFKNVRIKYQKGNTFYLEEMDQHTALVYEVKGKGSFVIAEQNTSRLGRKVGLNDLALDNVTKGKLQFFRPEKK